MAADLDDAVALIIFGAFYQSDQSYIGVQRIIVHAKIYDAFKEKSVAKALFLKMGDLKDKETFLKH